METSSQHESTASTPILNVWETHTEVFPGDVAADVPPNIEPIPSASEAPVSTDPIPYALLSKRRTRRNHMEALIEIEENKLEELFVEGEALKLDIVKYVAAVEELRNKRKNADSQWRLSLTEFNQLQKNCATMAGAVAGMKARWAEEVLVFREEEEKLMKLRSRKPQLEKELRSISQTCTLLAERVSAALEERKRLESILVRLEESSMNAAGLIQRADADVQTELDASSILDLTRIESDLKKQIKTVKNVREAIDLIKRCS
jgi:hypothetical protein